jgi:hypothetical protein
LTGVHPELSVDARLLAQPVRYAAYSWSSPLSRAQMQWLGRIAGYRPLPWTADAGGELPPAVADLARVWCADLIRRRERIGADAADPRRQRDELDLELAERIARRLTRDYSYSLDLSAADPARDPVEDFLFRTRSGHCEFFASAMTLMCRAVGVNARLATGYLAQEPDPAGGYLVRQCDAHAWCEVYTPSSDWRVFDPSPPRRRPGDGLLAGLRRLWDSVGFFWRTNVIGYGEADRRGLFGRLVEWFDWVGTSAVTFCVESVRSLWRLVAHGRVDRNLTRTAVAAALAVGGVVLAVASGKLLRRMRSARSRPGIRRGQVPAFYRRLLKLLQRRGIRQRPEQTAQEFLLEAAAKLGLPAGAVNDLAGLLYRIRWGGQAASAAELAGADQAVREFAGRIRPRRGPR